jgi:hypothetical protein
LKGNVILYDSYKDPLIRRAYANLRAKTNNGQKGNRNNTSSATMNSEQSNHIHNDTDAKSKSLEEQKRQKRHVPPKRNVTSPNNNKAGVNDTSLLGEMMFGAIPMQIKGQNTKVHFLPYYKQTVLTKLFQVGIPASTLANVDPLFDNKAKRKPKQAQSQHGSRHETELEVKISGVPSLHVFDEDYFSQDRKQSIGQGLGPRHRSMSTSVIMHQPHEHRAAPSKKENNSDTEEESKEFKSTHLSVNDILHNNEDKNEDHLSSIHGKYPIARKRKKKAYSELGQYMCKSVFALGVVIIFHEAATQTQGVDAMKAKNEFAQISGQLQKLLFSHFAIIEHRMRKLLKVCSNAIRNRLREAVDQAKDCDQLSKIFHGFTFNVRLIEHALQADQEVCDSAKDFQRFILSFIHSPRLEKPLWYTHSTFMVDKVNIFSQFLNHLCYVLDNSSLKMETFLCTLFTAVLTHHLSWTADLSEKVSSDLLFTDPSVILAEQLCSLFGAGYWSYDSNDNKSLQKSHKNASDSHQKRNALKCTGMKKFCKVVVVGSQETLVRHILYILSYLLRTRRIVENDYFIQSDRLQYRQKEDNAAPMDDLNNLSRSFNTDNFSYNRYSLSERDLETNTNSEDVYQEEDSIIRHTNFIEIGPTIRTAENSVISSSEIFRKRLEQYSHDISEEEVHGSDKLDTTLDDEDLDSEDNYEMVPLHSFSHIDQELSFSKQGNRARLARFGHALYGDMSSIYCGALVLMGLPKNVDFIEEAIKDLKLMQTEILDGDDEAPDTAACIIADTDDMICNIIISNNNKKHYQSNDMKQYLPKSSSIKFDEAVPSDFVVDMISNLKQFKMKGLSDSTCEAYFNDQLKLLYLKSISIVEIVEEITRRNSHIDHIFAQTLGLQHAQSEMSLENFVSNTPSTAQKSKERESPTSAKSGSSGTFYFSPSSGKNISYQELSSALNVTTRDLSMLLSIASTLRADVPFHVSKKSKIKVFWR